MAVAQDGNNNIFPVAFALVEGETGGAWSFFLKNLRTHVAPQPDLCLISDRHASIESAYNNPANGWHDLLLRMSIASGISSRISRGRSRTKH